MTPPRANLFSRKYGIVSLRISRSGARGAGAGAGAVREAAKPVSQDSGVRTSEGSSCSCRESAANGRRRVYKEL